MDYFIEPHHEEASERVEGQDNQSKVHVYTYPPIYLPTYPPEICIHIKAGPAHDDDDEQKKKKLLAVTIGETLIEPSGPPGVVLDFGQVGK